MRRVPTVGDVVEVFWPGEGWHKADVVPNSGKGYTRDLNLRSARGLAIPKDELFVIRDASGVLHTKHLNPREYGHNWRFPAPPQHRPRRRTSRTTTSDENLGHQDSDANHVTSSADADGEVTCQGLLATMTLLLAHDEHLHPGYAALFNRRMPLRRVTRAAAYSDRKSYESATDTAHFGALGGNARDLKREVESGALHLDGARFLPSERLADVLLTGRARLAALHDTTGLSPEQLRTQNELRASCEQAAEALFGDSGLCDFYAVMAHYGCALRYDDDDLAHLYCQSMDSNFSWT